MQLPPCCPSFLILLAQWCGLCEATGIIASSFRDFFGFPWTPQIALLNATSPSFADGTKAFIIRTIQDGDMVEQSGIFNALDLSIEYNRSYFVRQVQIRYTFTQETTATFDIWDSAPPFFLSDGADMTFDLTRIGLYEMSIAATSWYGIPWLGSAVSVRWTVVAPNVPTEAPGKTVTASPSPFLPTSVEILGELRVWHKITLAFHDGPFSYEDATPNPFSDYRLDVVFRNENVVMTVPGYFAADGNAANTGATSGSVWQCHWAPPLAGPWTWQATLRTGPNVAMAWPGTTTGTAVPPVDGRSGSLLVRPSDKTGRDFRGQGRLCYVPGKHHLQFAGTGEWFWKVGADSPENFLAYDGFDNTPNLEGRRKSWGPHVQDFVEGDPTWGNGNGTGIIGAINYLSNQGMRSFSFLTMNVGGDDGNVYPYVDPMNRLRFDVSKLAQWEVVFEHADRKGLFLHFKTQETENDQLLDSGALGAERKLYYRELIARFSHHLALNWNIGEENTNTPEEQKAFSDFFKALDPYQHPVVLHTYPDEQELVYKSLYGYPNYDGASLQSPVGHVFNNTLARVQESAASGRTWVVSNDEQGGSETGVVPDRVDPTHDNIRRLVLWGNLMAGGAGVEYYFGYDFENSDLTCQDFRSRANLWVQSRYALEFLSNYSIPFQDMINENHRVLSNSWCLVERNSGRVIVVYLRNGGSTTLNMTGLGNTPFNPSVSVDWYDPRNGGGLQKGTVTEVQLGVAAQSLGFPPNNRQMDWVVLLRQKIVTLR